MCGIIGITNFKKLNQEKFIESTNKLISRGPDELGIKLFDTAALGHRRLSVIDIKNGKQPMTFNGYTIIYNGELYNTQELREDLEDKGYLFDTNSDTEVLLKMYVEYKEECLNMLNGIYAFAIYKKGELFIARDKLGVKPLYYTINNNELFFSSELKGILHYYNINKVTKEGLCELIGLGPSHTPGKTPYKNVFELREGHFLKFNKKLEIKKYWNLYDLEFNKTFEETKEDIKFYVTDSIKRQLVSDVPLCTFLSGGLDSTAITAVAALNSNGLSTYSIDYEGNKENFKGNEFQVTEDSEYINYATKMYKTNHNNLKIPLDILANTLENAVDNRDLPGMADIDSSLYWFANKVKEKHTVALSGECADEIFGGYPWFYRDDKFDDFPWLRSLDSRIDLLKDDIKEELNIKKYVTNAYNNIIEESNTLDKHKQMFYLNTKYFMQTLLERKDRMTMGASLEVRVPFSDHRLVEYLYNVPWAFKFHNNVEKGLLREAVKDLIPKEIFTRKKSPYPKTHSKEYTELVKEKLIKALKNKDSILHKVFELRKLEELIKTNGEAFKKPWFGQLMTGPQLIAYLYQFHYWGEKYNIEIE